MEENNKQFSILSYNITKYLNSDIIKNNGIYFTPRDVIEICIEKIISIQKKNKIIINDIFEPCCGSCEFILHMEKHFENKNITGIENNSDIYLYTKNNNVNIKKNNFNHIHTNFFHYENDKKFDLIIGNPPYYVVDKNEINKKYHKYFDGRPNMFIIFLIECLKKLNKNGLLCFVLPINFLNCIYYDKTRQYIKNNFKIHDIILCENSKFLNTRQDVFIIILQNCVSQNKNKNYTLNINNYCIFHEKETIKELKEYQDQATHLNTLNFNIQIGNIIWNEHKSILTDDDSKTLLIYNSYIKDNKFNITSFKNIQKKNYINKKGLNEMCIILNRGYGKGKYNFSYALVDIEQDYLIENHCLVIKYMGDKDKDEVRQLYNQIINSFNQEKTKKFIDLYFKNNAINKNELLHILPIYLE